MLSQIIRQVRPSNSFGKSNERLLSSSQLHPITVTTAMVLATMVVVMMAVMVTASVIGGLGGATEVTEARIGKLLKANGKAVEVN